MLSLLSCCLQNDPWGAARYYAEAEKQEELEESRAADIQVGLHLAVCPGQRRQQLWPSMAACRAQTCADALVTCP